LSFEASSDLIFIDERGYPRKTSVVLSLFFWDNCDFYTLLVLTTMENTGGHLPE